MIELSSILPHAVSRRTRSISAQLQRPDGFKLVNRSCAAKSQAVGMPRLFVRSTKGCERYVGIIFDFNLRPAWKSIASLPGWAVIGRDRHCIKINSNKLTFPAT